MQFMHLTMHLDTLCTYYSCVAYVIHIHMSHVIHYSSHILSISQILAWYSIVFSHMHGISLALSPYFFIHAHVLSFGICILNYIFTCAPHMRLLFLFTFQTSFMFIFSTMPLHAASISFHISFYITFMHFVCDSHYLHFQYIYAFLCIIPLFII